MTPDRPRVSVIIPTHNRTRLLPLTLRSALGQVGVALEVLVVDDGSTEDVEATVRAAGDPRVRLFRHDRPEGVSAARNRGLREATGDWVAFLDDDDLWAPGKLRAQLDEAARAGAHWVYAGAVNVTEDLRLLGGAPPALPADVRTLLARANLIPGGCSGVIVRRDHLPPEPFDRSLSTFADWDLWIRLGSSGAPAAVAQPLVGYRIHGRNMSSDTARMVAELAVIEARYGGPIDRTRFSRHLARISLRAGQHRRAARHYLKAGAVDAAYRSGELLPDLTEVARSRVMAWRHRLGRVLPLVRPAAGAGPDRRYAAHQPWLDAARPWLAALSAAAAAATPSPDVVDGFSPSTAAPAKETGTGGAAGR